MMVFIFVPSARFPGASTVDASWSLDENPDALTLAAIRAQQLHAAGVDAKVRTHGGAFIVPASRMVH